MRQPPKTSTVIDRHDPDYDARNDRWLSPLPLIRALGTFDLDPAGAPGHPTADTVWVPEEVGDGLSMPWFGRVWLNPPYGRTMIDWIAALADHGTGTALIFARTETHLFHEHVFPRASALLFVRKRLTFQAPDGRVPGNKGHATAPSVLIAYGDADARALASSGIPGAFIALQESPDSETGEQ